MAWYYEMHGVSLGPVPEAKLRDLLKQDMVTSETLVWTDGMAEWLPYQQTALALAPVPAAARITAPAVVVPAGMRVCAECGQPFPEDDMIQYEQSWVCAACKPVFFQRIKEGVAVKDTLSFAPIGKRFVAVLIDGLIAVFIIGLLVILPFLLTATWVMPGGKTLAEQGWVTTSMIILCYGLPAAYEIFFIGKYGATPGKMAMKIKVVTASGGLVSYGLSVGRYLAKVLGRMILYIGYLIALGDEEKRALHDRLCNTRVIENLKP